MVIFGGVHIRVEADLLNLSEKARKLTKLYIKLYIKFSLCAQSEACEAIYPTLADEIYSSFEGGGAYSR